MIGSVHVGPDSPYDESRVDAWAAGRSFDELVAPYFAEVLAAARSGLFDMLGHLDFVKRYVIDHAAPAAFAERLDLYEPILRALVDSGDRPRGQHERAPPGAAGDVPGRPVVARYRELGGRRVTAGSDAHRADWFAVGLAEGYRIVAEAGFDELAFRRGARARRDRAARAVRARVG